MNGLWDDLAAAIELLTRIPVGWIRRTIAMPDLARIVWAYPVVGCIVGAIGSLVYWLATTLGCPAPLAAIWCVGALVLTTGAFHEDGLADIADGFGGGRTPERKLEIMRDSRAGSYGVIALVISLALRGAAIALIADPGPVAAALIVAGAAGRGAIIGPLLLLPPARSDGLAAQGGRPQTQRAAVGLGIAVLLTLVLAPAGAGRAATLAGAIGCLVIVEIARRQIGGYTGDVLGAAEQVVECLVLTAIAAAA